MSNAARATCPTCNGFGSTGLRHEAHCVACDGTGYEPVRCSHCHELDAHDEECPTLVHDTDIAPPAFDGADFETYCAWASQATAVRS